MCLWVLFAAPTVVSVLRTGIGATQLGAAFAFIGWGVVWIWFWLRSCGRGTLPSGVGLAANTVILCTLVLVAPGPVGAGGVLVFAFIIAGVAFPLRQALWVLLLLSVVQVGAMMARQEPAEAEASSLINSVLVGGVGAAGRLMWLGYEQLAEARLEVARLAVSEERLRFARDVHDILGQSLATIVLKSELIGRQLPADADESLRHEAEDITRVGRKSLADLREAVAGYRMPTLPAELSSARSALRAAGIAFVVDDRAGGLPADEDSVLAWCLREAVTNVVKHSGASRCEVAIVRDNGSVRLSVEDDGKGTESLDAGSGLAGMRERVVLAGGTFEVGRDREGMAIRVTIPAGAPAEPPA
jgi:two-component system, NarL family, sensor histidine kinase DesK